VGRRLLGGDRLAAEGLEEEVRRGSTGYSFVFSSTFEFFFSSSFSSMPR